MRSTSRGRCSRRATPATSSAAVPWRGRGHRCYVAILRRNLASLAVDRSWLIALFALIVYAAIASPHIVDGDSGEFATLAALGGRAHPSGYPAYVVWLRLWAWLPGTPAHAAGLATAILGALTVGVVHAACRAWGARPLAAMIAAAMFGAAPLVQRYACEAEVFALNDLVAALVVWLAAADGPLRGRGRAAALGAIAGVGLANHLTCALVAPLGVLGVVRAARESRPASYAVAAAGLVLGLAPYAYLAIADGPASWGEVGSPADLLAIVLRTDYGGAASFAGAGVDVPWTASVMALIATLMRSWLGVPAVAGVAMLGVRIWRPRAVAASSSSSSSSSSSGAGESRWAWAMLAASFVVAGPVLVSRFNIDPHGLGRYVCERFHLLPVTLLAVPVAAALDVVCARVARPVAATVIAVIGFVALSLAALPGLARVHSPALELGVQNLLGSLPPGAIAVVIADDHCAGASYLQLARGRRPDVAVICDGLVSTAWYRAAWARRGLVLPAARSALGDALLASGRPVFVDAKLERLVAGFPSFAFGVLRRILPRTARPPAAADVAAINRDVFAAFDLDYPRPRRDDDYAALAHFRYAGTWADIARQLSASGDRDGARAALDLARALLPEGTL